MCIHRLLCGFTGPDLPAAAMRCELMIICVLNVEMGKKRGIERVKSTERKTDGETDRERNVRASHRCAAGCSCSPAQTDR